MANILLKSKGSLKRIELIGVLLIPVILYFIPINWFTGQHSVCIFKNIWRHDCYGCGMTRAIISAIQFDFAAAYNYNKIFVIVLPLLIYIWIKTLIKLIITNV
jgi:hypothetical protein